MTFVEMIKVLGVKALFEEFNENLLLIKQFINIHFKKNESFDTSRYMREIKKYLHIDFDKTYLEELIDFAENVGVSEEEVLLLFENGFDEFEIEQLLENPIQLQCCIKGLLNIFTD